MNRPKNHFLFRLGLLALLVLGSCAKKEGPSISVTFPAMSGAQKSFWGFNFFNKQTRTGQNIPSTVSGFDCLFINVMGDGIGDWKTHKNSVKTRPNAYFGNYSGMIVPADGGTVSVTVPAGASRIVQVLGVISSVGCPSSPTVSSLNSKTDFLAVYEIGRKTVDIFSDVSITINSDYNPATVQDTRYQNLGNSPTLSSLTPATGVVGSIPSSLTATFSEVMANPSGSAFSLGGTCTSNPTVTPTTVNGVVTATLSGGTCNDGQQLTVTVTPSGFRALSGKSGVGASVTKTYTISSSGPTVSLGAPSSNTITSSDSTDIAATFTASAAGANSLTGTLTAGGAGFTVTTVSGNPSCTKSASGISVSGATLTLSSCTGNGVVKVNVNAGVVKDPLNNSNAASGFSSNLTVDNAAPTVGTAISFSAVTASSMTVNWGAATDDVTAQASLQYKVVKGSASTDIDTVAEADAVAGGNLVMNWTANTTTKAVTGLSDSTTYYFAVLVKDALGNKALYTPASQATTDATNPTVGTAISFSSVSSTSLTVNWGAGSDNVTAQSSLQYKVVKASASASIDTVAEADAIVGGNLVMDWTANTTTKAVTGLTDNTTYWFAVLVKDAAGNKALYTPASQATTDGTAPSVGTGISFSSVASTSLTVNWGAATDSVTAQASLQYKVVKASASADIDTVGEADAIVGGNLLMDWTANTTTKAVTGLSSSTTYWFAVLVKDAAGNKALYTPASQATTSGAGPTVGTAISFSSVASTSMTVDWGAATDDVTAQASLEYKLVKASSSTAIDTVAEADAITGGNLLMDWTANTITYSVTGLTDSTTYYFAVLVKDEDGNMSLYTPAGQATTDVTNPTVGTAISFSSVSSTSLSVDWGAATDNITAQASLQYKVVKASASVDIDTVAEADAIVGANLVMNWTANTTTKSVTGLSDSTTYWFAVLVKDAAGNKALYTPASQATTDGTAPTVGTAISFSSVSSTSLSVDWGAATDAVTAQASLQYKLVKSSTSAAIDTVGEVDAITGGNLLMDWTANTITKAVTGLTDSTTYYFAVLVKDAAGNKALYTPAGQATTDGTAPTVGTAISFASVASTSMTVNWGAATDAVTAQASLQYKLVKSSTSAAIDTVAEVDAITGGNLLMDWTANTTTNAVTGLSSSTTYWFAVLVKDAAGNMALYSPNSQTTTAPDNTAPTVGTAIVTSNPSSSSITATWGAATDGVTAQASLDYKLVRASTSAAIDTVAEADAATVVMDWTANTLTKVASGLSSGTTYWFAVLVRDAALNKAIYAPVSGTTTNSKIIFTTNSQYSPSSSDTATTFNGIAGADAKCASDAGNPGTGTTFKAMLVDSNLREACTSANCTTSGTSEGTDWVLQSGVSYQKVSGTVVGTANSNGVFTFSLSATIGDSSSPGTWTGLNADWTSATADCLAWTSNSSSDQGQYGFRNATNSNAIDKGSANCSTSYRLYCVEQ